MPKRAFQECGDSEVDELDAYIATFTEAERKELAAAAEAIDKEIAEYRTQAPLGGRGHVQSEV